MSKIVPYLNHYITFFSAQALQIFRYTYGTSKKLMGLGPGGPPKATLASLFSRASRKGKDQLIYFRNIIKGRGGNQRNMYYQAYLSHSIIFFSYFLNDLDPISKNSRSSSNLAISRNRSCEHFS